MSHLVQNLTMSKDVSDIMYDIDTDDEVHTYQNACLIELKDREKVEARYQLKRFKYYLKQLSAMELEVDKFLRSEDRGEPDNRMIHFANHPWCYNRLSLEKKIRISKLRLIVAESAQKKIEDEMKFWCEVRDETVPDNKSICSICDMRSFTYLLCLVVTFFMKNVLRSSI